MKNSSSMSKMNVGDKGRVYKFIAPDNIRKRLLDIGLYEGCVLECVLKSPSGDPTAYNINGAIIALRNDDCKNILLKIEKLGDII